jgi:phosphoribosylformimino-5-aminoimidazole carboxamide ribotide isomerase
VLILPAIDIRHGNCVRLYQGRSDQETIYSHNPIDVAHYWKDKGAQMLHVVDLDGAFEGKPINLPLIEMLRKDVDIPIEVGGGFRNIQYVREAFERGADRVILGTAAIYNPDLVVNAVEEYTDAISVSIDVSGRFAAADGWKEISAIPFDELAEKMRSLGVAELLFTDTSRDGTLKGPNLNVIRQFLEAAALPTIVSGGVTSLEDIADLKDLESHGLKGVIIGKALYDKKFPLEDALHIAAHAG